MSQFYYYSGVVRGPNSNAGHMVGWQNESFSSSVPVHVLGSYRQGITFGLQSWPNSPRWFSFPLYIYVFNFTFALTFTFYFCSLSQTCSVIYHLFTHVFSFGLDVLVFVWLSVEIACWFRSPWNATNVSSRSECRCSSPAYRYWTTATNPFWENTIVILFY